MRITQSMMSRGYLKRMNQNLSGLAASNNKLASGTKYSRASENISASTRAFAVREQISRNEQYTETIKNAEGVLSAAEGNLQMVNNLMHNLEDRLTQANTGTVSDNERQLIANELEGIQHQLLQITNSQFNGKFIFSGSGNSSGKAPFEVGPGGKLLYNGYVVDDVRLNNLTGKHEAPNPNYDPNDPDSDEFLELKYNAEVYLDIGMGLAMNGAGTGVELDTKSAFRVSTSGLDTFGFGMDADGMPKNLFSLIGKTIDDIRNGDGAGMDADMKAVRDTYDGLLAALTDLGTRSTYLEDSWNRLDTENINLKTTQQQLEATPLEQETIYNKSYEMSWMVTLQLGSKIIPPSIFDFIK